MFRVFFEKLMPFVLLAIEKSLITCSFKVRKFIRNFKKQTNLYILEKEGKVQVNTKSLVLQMLHIKKKNLKFAYPSNNFFPLS